MGLDSADGVLHDVGAVVVTTAEKVVAAREDGVERRMHTETIDTRCNHIVCVCVGGGSK